MKGRAAQTGRATSGSRRRAGHTGAGEAEDEARPRLEDEAHALAGAGARGGGGVVRAEAAEVAEVGGGGGAWFFETEPSTGSWYSNMSACPQGWG